MKAFAIATAMLMTTAAVPLGGDTLPSTVDMSGARISTEKQAQHRLYEHLIQARDDGLGARHSGRTVVSFRIGFDIPDFARTGDRVWLIHVVDIADGTVKRVAWINAESGAITFPLEKGKGEPGQGTLQLCCSMAETEFVVGEELPPPEVTLRNSTDADIDLIDPAITVIECILLQPDRSRIPMRLAMPTGLDPRHMPPRKLEAGGQIEFTPQGMWHYEDKGGFQRYVFRQEGSYEFTCQCKEVTSNSVSITVRGKASEPAPDREQQ